ncbi:hypothetical protein JCM30760_07540 [Thiomicrorhabdus hydrogeniphila]
MTTTRRELLLTIGAALASLPLTNVIAATEKFNLPSDVIGNFQYIYSNNGYRQEFYDFLVNVFHLYPEDELHSVIHLLTKQNNNDQEIYKKLQQNLARIKPLLADITYALPALSKQKQLLAQQTTQLIDTKIPYENYLEIGSTGRYLDTLEEKFTIQGERFFLTNKPAGYTPVEILDRGQIFKAGIDIDLNNYQTDLAKTIPNQSLDLVSVFIGFHHCPVDQREAFISSIRDAMSHNAMLILRDHDAHNQKMRRMAALAHDVFNAGTHETWQTNQEELRNFYSLAQLEQMMIQFGFKPLGKKLYQPGDPTLNALMAFQKA